jgi:hypothetical protein
MKGGRFCRVVLYSSKYGSLRAFENNMLWRIFGPKREEVKKKMGKLYNEELHNCTLH